jgi:hypothetical protein
MLSVPWPPLMLVCRADSLIPIVGQRDTAPSVRSNTSTGKLSSNPPSTQVTRPPAAVTSATPAVTAAARTRTGSKKNGMDIDARTASTIRSPSASSPYS